MARKKTVLLMTVGTGIGGSKEVIDEYGKIDVLANNAGITKDMLLMRMKEEDFQSVIDLNLVGTFNVTKNEKYFSQQLEMYYN